MSWLVAALIVTLTVLVARRASGRVWLASMASWLTLVALTQSVEPVWLTALGLVLVGPPLLLSIIALRRRVFTAPLLAIFKKALPGMSKTEREAIEAGTVWWEGELFAGRPRWDALLANGPPRLREAERAFIDQECERLAEFVDDWQTSAVLNELSPEAWNYIKSQGFLGMIIGTQYGGKEFTAYAHSQVVMKLSSRSPTAAVSVMVPNSLGPAELLLHYGTDAQKSHFLPRLAKGEDIPCFALTSPYAGSDAAAIPDVGIACKQEYQGRETVGFR